MKTKLLILFCLILANTTYSQDYYPLVVEDNIWNVMAVGVMPPSFDSVLSTESYKISGDTVINSVAYKKLYITMEEIPVQWNLWGFMREEADKKVWLKPDWITEEFLMYDFAIEEGDSIYVGMIDPAYLVVDSITIVSINETQRQKFWLSGIDMPDYKETWIVGIGSNRGIVWSGSAYITGGWYWLLCLSNNGEMIYMNPNYDFCYINTVDIIENKGNSIEVYPIPVRDNLKINNIDHVNILSISIHDFSGQKVLDFETNSTDLNLSSLSPGTYLLRIGYQNGVISKKIIVE